MARVEIIVSNVAFKGAMWQLECEAHLGHSPRPSAIWCPDPEQDCGLAAVDDSGCLRCFFSGGNVDVGKAVAFFQSCLLN
jgi:hypothetical protein